MSVDFIDSNVFVYLFDEVNAKKRRIAERIVHEALSIGNSLISFQVVQETLNVLTRKIETPLNASDAERILSDVLAPLWRIAPSADLYRRGLVLQSRYRLSFYDSMIVAAALEGSCTRLFSEDMQSGLKIDKLTIVNPFVG